MLVRTAKVHSEDDTINMLLGGRDDREKDRGEITDDDAGTEVYDIDSDCDGEDVGARPKERTKMEVKKKFNDRAFRTFDNGTTA